MFLLLIYHQININIPQHNRKIKDNIKDNIKDIIKENIKDTIKENFKSKIKDNNKDKLKDIIKDIVINSVLGKRFYFLNGFTSPITRFFSIWVLNKVRTELCQAQAHIMLELEIAKINFHS